METSRVRYEIAYDKTKQSVIVYPQWRGTRPNHLVIGDYTPENPQADFDEYRGELGEVIREALKRVGQHDPYAFKIIVTPLDGGNDFVAREADGMLARVPVEDQIPVSDTKSVAEATHEELQKAEPVPHVAVGLPKGLPEKETPKTEPAKKKATKKATKKK